MAFRKIVAIMAARTRKSYRKDVDVLGLDDFISSAELIGDGKNERLVCSFISMKALKEYNEYDHDNSWYPPESLNNQMWQNHIGFRRQDDYVSIYDTNEYAVCDDCGYVFQKSTMEDVCGGYRHVCTTCMDEYMWCERCEEYEPADGFEEVHTADGETEYWCKDCVNNHANYCERCEKWYDNDMCLRGADDKYYCIECWNELFVECYDCGKTICREDAYYDNDGDAFCSDCWESNHHHDIRSYHDNPDTEYHYADDEKHDHKCFIGTEVETEHGDIDKRVDVTMRWGDYENIIYQMHDGSLDDSGIECITQPMSKEFFDSFDFEGWMDELKSVGARSHDTDDCGLHVHLSRGWMGTNDEELQALYVGRMKQFISDNQKMVERYARRSENHWCEYKRSYDKRRYKNSATKELKESAHKDNAKCGDRYQSVNNRNWNTIEFRIFRGTLNANTFRASVEFCLRLVDYIITHAEEAENWYDFLTYKPLPASMERYLKERNLSIE